MTRILLVEDDKDYAELLTLSLKKVGYDVDTAYNFEEGFNVTSKVTPDLILLDVMLPDGNGYDFCKEVYKTQPEIPIIMLSAVRQTEEDKITGLESGAIDYVLKSHSHKELIARVKRILKQYESEPKGEKTSLQLSDKTKIVLDVLHQKALVNDRPMFLTSIEFQLLYIFIKNVNKVLGRNAILKMIWEYEPKESQTLKVHIYRLRKKLFKYIPKEDFDIMPVRGTGYVFTTKGISRHEEVSIVMPKELKKERATWSATI